jgi:hypothetical protein
VERRHLDRLLGDAGLGAAAARRRLRGLADAAPPAARAVRAQLGTQGWDATILDTIIDIVDRRARRLHELTGPAPSSRARRAP